MTVGTDQGTGFIYDRSDWFMGTPGAPAFLEQMALQQIVSGRKAAATKAASGQAVKSLSPGEYWIKHDQELRTKLDEVQTLGANILSTGQDPFTGTDPASLRFQKELVRMEQGAQFSMQIKDYHKFLAEKMATESKEGGDRYTEESKAEAEAYLSRGVFENMDSGQVPPILEVKRPMIDLLAYDSGIAKEAMSGDRKPTDADIAVMAETSMTNPQVAEALASQLAQLQREDPEAVKLLQTRAQNAGMSVQKYLRTQQMLPHFRQPLEEFDFESVEKQMMPGEVASEIEKGDKTIFSTAVPEKKIRSLATTIVTANPKYVQAGVAAGRFGSPDKTIEENTKAAIEYNAKRVKDQAASTYGEKLDEASKSGYGASVEEVRANGQEWLKALRSGNRALVAEAVAYLKNAKIPMADGRMIKDYRIKSDKSGLLVELITVKSLEEKDEDGNKILKEDTGIIIFDPNKPEGIPGVWDSAMSEEMLNLHDASFKSTKRPFAPTLPTYKGPAAEVQNQFKGTTK